MALFNKRDLTEQKIGEDLIKQLLKILKWTSYLFIAAYAVTRTRQLTLI